MRLMIMSHLLFVLVVHYVNRDSACHIRLYILTCTVPTTIHYEHYYFYYYYYYRLPTSTFRYCLTSYSLTSYLLPNLSTDFATISPSTKIVFIPEYSGDGVLCLD